MHNLRASTHKPSSFRNLEKDSSQSHYHIILSNKIHVTSKDYFNSKESIIFWAMDKYLS